MEYPDAKPQLIYNSDYQLLVAVILSAQCTDKRVNIVTEELFKDYGTPKSMITLSQTELGEIIKPCGLYNAKAKHYNKFKHRRAHDRAFFDDWI